MGVCRRVRTLKTGQVSRRFASSVNDSENEPASAGQSFLTESLILAQGERWRRALDMQVER